MPRSNNGSSAKSDGRQIRDVSMIEAAEMILASAKGADTILVGASGRLARRDADDIYAVGRKSAVPGRHATHARG